MYNKIMMVSESADLSSSPAGALIACLATITLDINSNSITEFRNSYRTWSDNARSFASRFGFSKELKAVSTRVIKGEDIYGDDEDVIALGKAIRAAKNEIYADTRISREVTKLIQAGARCLVRDDESAWNYLMKNISHIKETRLTSVFLTDDDEPIQIDGLGADTASQEMKRAYQALMGNAPKSGYFVSPIQIPELRQSKPKQFEEYSRLAKVLNRETKRLVYRIVRQSGKAMLPVDEVSKALDKAGIMHNMPRGFIGGQIDENMKFYTAEGRQLDKAPAGAVKMNPNYDPAQDNTYVLYVLGYGDRVGAARVRTTTMNTANKAKRHAAVSEFIENEDKVRAKWLKDLKRKGTKEQLMAMMVELLFVTSARIGGPGNKSSGEKTYGLTTLTKEHVGIKGQFLLFNYTGKKLASQAASYPLGSVEGKLIAEIMKKKLADLEPGELVFTFRGKPILRQAVSKYLKSLGTKMQPHSFRRSTGTKMALQILANSPFTNKGKNGEPIKESEVNRWFKKEMEKIGEALHHRNGEKVTGMTAVKSYIDPTVISNFYESLNLRVPNFVPKAKDVR
jgi:DNA topoisomerase IB